MLKSKSIFESILDQDLPIRILTTLHKKNIIPNALLFTGINGIGKKKCSIAFAMLCNCLNEKHLNGKNNNYDNKIAPCGKCISCNKVLSGNHPDIILLEPSGSSIKIDQIRNLCHILSMKPFEAKLRVVIIPDAQAMSNEAGNALLKNLEEPPEKTVFVLTATHESDLLPTIVSRCHNIRFSPVKKSNISYILINQYDIDKNDARLFADISSGSVGKAVLMSIERKKFDWIKHKRWILKIMFENILGTPSAPIIMAFAETLSKNREIVQDSLEMIISAFKNFIMYQYRSENIIDNDIKHNIENISEKISVESIIKKIRAVQSAQKNISSNANVNLRLTLETLFLKLSSI